MHETPMTYRQRFSFGLIGLTVLILNACSTGRNTPATIEGKAIDGYLGNSKVCVDKNLNFRCDAGEPYAITASDGSYSIDWNEGNAAGLVVITEATENTIDSDDDGKTFAQAGRKPFVLAAPIPVGATTNVMVTPLTTVITANALSDTAAVTRLLASDVQTAENSLKTLLGIDSSKNVLTLDVTKDPTIKPIAQVMAHILGEIQSGVTEKSAAKIKASVVALVSTYPSLFDGGNLIPAALNALASPPEQRAAAIKQIGAIGSTINSVTKVINRGSSVVDVPNVLRGGIAVFEENSFNVTYDESAECKVGQVERGRFLRAGIFTFDTITSVRTELQRTLNGSWSRRGNYSDRYQMTPSGTWEASSDNPFRGDQVSIVSDSNCAYFKDSRFANKSQICFSEIDLSGLRIQEVNSGYCNALSGGWDQLACQAAVFKSGSKGYEFTLTGTGADSYSIDVPCREENKNGHFGNQWNGVVATSMPEFISMLVVAKENPDLYLRMWSDFALRLNTYNSQTQKGVFDWFLQEERSLGEWIYVPAGTSDFEIKRVNGLSVLVFKPSLKYHQVNPGEMVGQDFIFTVKDEKIRLGVVEYKDYKYQFNLNGYIWIGNRATLESFLEGLQVNGTSLAPFPFP